MICRRAFLYLFLLVVASYATPSARADVELPSIISDSMVLQCDMPTPVWGWAETGEKVTVSFAGQTKSATADEAGRWQVKLDAMAPNSDAQVLAVVGKNRIEIKDILIGEVWICSGQSNMEWSVSRTVNPQQEMENADYPKLRLFDVPGHTISPLAKDKCPGAWQTCRPDSVPGFSAVGYFFGRRLLKELKVPIGLVGSNWGGTRIEPWVSPTGFRSVPELKDIAEQLSSREAKSQAGEEVKLSAGSPSAIYNAMVHPLAPYAMRGGIWYQGESNGGEGESYYHKKRALINGWRELFNPDLAFYWVQLANFREPNEDPKGGDGWAKLREAQCTALTIPHTGMAVIIDIGEAKDIHPRNKQDVGSRLAQWALHQTYDRSDLVPSGPLYKSHTVENGTIRLSFDHVGSGLMVGEKQGLEPTKQLADGQLKRFAISGTDGQWHWADATIDGVTVVVKSAEVAEPVAVRYAFTTNPQGANLYNKEGLPASPFRTDRD